MTGKEKEPTRAPTVVADGWNPASSVVVRTSRSCAVPRSVRSASSRRHPRSVECAQQRSSCDRPLLRSVLLSSVVRAIDALTQGVRVDTQQEASGSGVPGFRPGTTPGATPGTTGRFLGVEGKSASRGGSEQYKPYLVIGGGGAPPHSMLKPSSPSTSRRSLNEDGGLDGWLVQPGSPGGNSGTLPTIHSAAA
eukprot:1195714-Prorocentrum_minimum.AAC.3